MSHSVIEIVFTKSRKRLPIWSWLIRTWTQKPYSHVALQQEVKDWGHRYYQASEGKVNYEYETYFKIKHKIVQSYCIEIPKELDAQIKKACYQESGNIYAFWQNLGIAVTDIYYRIVKKKIDNPWKRGRNCSEIIYTKCLKILFPELNYDENTIKPHHIESIIEDRFVQDCNGCWRLK